MSTLSDARAACWNCGSEEEMNAALDRYTREVRSATIDEVDSAISNIERQMEHSLSGETRAVLGWLCALLYFPRDDA